MNKLRNKIRWLILGIFSFVIIVVIYYFFFFDLFGYSEKLLAELHINDYTIEIITTGSVNKMVGDIHIVRSFKNKESITLHIVEHHPVLKKISMLDSTTVEVQLGTKYSDEFLPTDTLLIVKVKK